MAHGQGNAEVVSDGSPSLTCNHEAPIVCSTQYGDLAGSLTARHDSSPCADHSMNIVAIPLLEVGKRTGVSTDDPRSGIGVGVDGDPMFTLQAGAQHGVAVAFSCKDHGADAGELAPTLRAMGHNGSHQNGGGQIAVAFESRFARNGRVAPSDVVPPLKAQSGETGKGDASPLVATPGMVRRLTPVECSRLQGFADDYLPSVVFRGKCPPSDGPMYKALGNSMAVPVMVWIGRRIKSVIEGRQP